MIKKEITDLLLAINRKVSPENNLSLIINYYYNRKTEHISTYYSLTMWYGKRPDKSTYYTKYQLLAKLSLILKELP